MPGNKFNMTHTHYMQCEISCNWTAGARGKHFCISMATLDTYIVDIDVADSKKGNLFFLVHSNSGYAMASECNVPALSALFCIG
jgi:hypothetical protein